MTRRLFRSGIVLAAVLLADSGCAPRSASAPGTAGVELSPTGAVEDLLTADRTFSAASAHTDLVAGLTGMFSDRLLMAVPPGRWAEGPAQAREALRANPDHAGARIEWSPIRGGVSADGQHGFTFGYMTMRKADGTTVPLKYLSYWVKEANGWRVVAYRRGRRPPGDVSLALLAPSLPARIVAPRVDAAETRALEASLRAAEQAFSDEAQKIGLGPAFAKHGSADAVNMGSAAGFTMGAGEIGKAIGGPAPSAASPVTWNADRALVASSGDLGVTYGVIRSNTDASAPGQPFFTVWRRAGPGAPWRYIAE